MDPNAPRRAADRVAQLIVESGGGSIGGVTDAYPEPVAPLVIGFDLGELDRVLGRTFTVTEVVDVLEPLGFETAGAGPIDVTVPTRRVDVTRPIDFVEEVARFAGYDSFGTRVATGPGYGLPVREERYRRLRESLVGAGLYEIVTFSFIGQADLDALALPADDERRIGIAVTNPLRAEEGVMRTTLLPGLLQAAANNINRRNDGVALFETGKVFLKGPPDIPSQPETVAFVITGRQQRSWLAGEDELNVTLALGLVERLSRDMGVALSSHQASPPAMHPGRTAEVRVGENSIGFAGELLPRVAARHGLEGRVIVGELTIEELLAPTAPFVVTQPSSFPPVIFDLAFDLPVATPAAVVEMTLAAASEMVERVDLFDVFEGEPLDEGRKSLAYRVMLRAQDRTLTDDDAAQVRDAMAAAITEAHDGRLRSA